MWSRYFFTGEFVLKGEGVVILEKCAGQRARNGRATVLRGREISNIILHHWKHSENVFKVIGDSL